MNTVKKQQGFTIIEVVLVLAIAALIFLMIFVALPALQRGQRDTARKQDVGAIASAINTYRSNHRGALTGLTAATLKNDYVNNLSQLDVDGMTVGSVGSVVAAPAETDDTSSISLGAKCGTDNNATRTGASSRQAAVVTRLEQGGLYCQEA